MSRLFTEKKNNLNTKSVFLGNKEEEKNSKWSYIFKSF